MDSSLLQSLAKKDDDLEIVQQTFFTTTLKTTVPSLATQGAGGEGGEEEDDFPPQQQSVPVRVIRYLFIMLALMWFGVGIFGIVPAQILLKYAPYPTISLTLFVASSAVGTCLLGGLFITRKSTEMVYTCFVVMVCCLFTALFSAAAFFHTLGPFQGSTILFLECVTVLVYCLYTKKELDGWFVAVCMSCVGVCVWLCGLVAFVREQDWITSGVLFVGCVVVFPIYSALFIHHSAKRFHLGDFSEVIVGFFTDFYVVPLQWMYAKCATNKTPPLDAHAGKSGIAGQSV